MEYRKVTYEAFEPSGRYIDRNELKEYKKKNGLFHCWYLLDTKCPKAIIENEDGSLVLVDYNQFVFGEK